MNHTPQMRRAAEWYASLSFEKRMKINGVSVLRDKFGLTAREAIEAMREATLMRARAV